MQNAKQGRKQNSGKRGPNDKAVADMRGKRMPTAIEVAKDNVYELYRELWVRYSRFAGVKTSAYVQCEKTPFIQDCREAVSMLDGQSMFDPVTHAPLWNAHDIHLMPLLMNESLVANFMHGEALRSPWHNTLRQTSKAILERVAGPNVEQPSQTRQTLVHSMSLIPTAGFRCGIGSDAYRRQWDGSTAREHYTNQTEWYSIRHPMRDVHKCLERSFVSAIGCFLTDAEIVAISSQYSGYNKTMVRDALFALRVDQRRNMGGRSRGRSNANNGEQNNMMEVDDGAANQQDEQDGNDGAAMLASVGASSKVWPWARAPIQSMQRTQPIGPYMVMTAHGPVYTQHDTVIIHMGFENGDEEMVALGDDEEQVADEDMRKADEDEAMAEDGNAGNAAPPAAGGFAPAVQRRTQKKNGVIIPELKGRQRHLKVSIDIVTRRFVPEKIQGPEMIVGLFNDLTRSHQRHILLSQHVTVKVAYGARHEPQKEHIQTTPVAFKVSTCNMGFTDPEGETRSVPNDGVLPVSKTGLVIHMLGRGAPLTLCVAQTSLDEHRKNMQRINMGAAGVADVNELTASTNPFFVLSDGNNSMRQFPSEVLSYGLMLRVMRLFEELRTNPVYFRMVLRGWLYLLGEGAENILLPPGAAAAQGAGAAAYDPLDDERGQFNKYQSDHREADSFQMNNMGDVDNPMPTSFLRMFNLNNSSMQRFVKPTALVMNYILRNRLADYQQAPEHISKHTLSHVDGGVLCMGFDSQGRDLSRASLHLTFMPVARALDMTASATGARLRNELIWDPSYKRQFYNTVEVAAPGLNVHASEFNPGNEDQMQINRFASAVPGAGAGLLLQQQKALPAHNPTFSRHDGGYSSTMWGPAVDSGWKQPDSPASTASDMSGFMPVHFDSIASLSATQSSLFD